MAIPGGKPSLEVSDLVQCDLVDEVVDQWSVGCWVRGHNQGVSKLELIEFAKDERFPFVAQSETATQKGYYRLLDRHVIDPLSEKGYITIERVGRQKFVTLTAEDSNALQAFGHLVDTERIESEE